MKRDFDILSLKCLSDSVRNNVVLQRKTRKFILYLRCANKEATGAFFIVTQIQYNEKFHVWRAPWACDYFLKLWYVSKKFLIKRLKAVSLIFSQSSEKSTSLFSLFFQIEFYLSLFSSFPKNRRIPRSKFIFHFSAFVSPRSSAKYFWVLPRVRNKRSRTEQAP